MIRASIAPPGRTADEPQKDAQEAREEDRGKPHGERQPGAVDDRREDAPALVVGPQEVVGRSLRVPDGRRQGVGQGQARQIVGIVGRDEGREKRGEDIDGGDRRRRRPSPATSGNCRRCRRRERGATRRSDMFDESHHALPPNRPSRNDPPGAGDR